LVVDNERVDRIQVEGRNRLFKRALVDESDFLLGGPLELCDRQREFEFIQLLLLQPCDDGGHLVVLAEAVDLYIAEAGERLEEVHHVRTQVDLEELHFVVPLELNVLVLLRGLLGLYQGVVHVEDCVQPARGDLLVYCGRGVRKQDYVVLQFCLQVRLNIQLFVHMSHAGFNTT